MKRLATIVSLLLLGSTGTVAAQTPGAPFLEEMTWTEVRDAIAAGKTAVIVPIGGVEQNGLHIILGKHNYSVRAAAELMAGRVNALVAPTVEYVPEGDYNRPNFGRMPGTISNPSPSYDALLDAIARSLVVHGFTDVLFIGDSGSDQNGMTAVADKINAEWAGTGKRVYALRDYYEKGREHLFAWLLAQYGYDAETVGSHAGIVGTSQIMYVKPEGIRRDKMVADPALGVRGDPNKSTPEIGRMILEFKANAGMLQYQALKAAANRPTEASRPQSQGQTVLDNAYVSVTRDGAPCAAGTGAQCGDRVIVAMEDVQLRVGGAVRALRRGGIAVFRPGEAFQAPAAGHYYEVAFKPSRPPVQSPPEAIPPPGENVLLHDADRFFVFEEKLPVGGYRERHGHSQRVVIQLNATRLQQKPDGQPEVTRDIVPDRPSFNEAIMHDTRNVGDLPLHGIVIEFKRERAQTTR
jgi:creatinine amidohydrolase/Fe(II)-dependent formamide hydrolase-like protein